jgi:hypothetical protein
MASIPITPKRPSNFVDLIKQNTSTHALIQEILNNSYSLGICDSPWQTCPVSGYCTCQRRGTSPLALPWTWGHGIDMCPAQPYFPCRSELLRDTEYRDIPSWYEYLNSPAMQIMTYYYSLKIRSVHFHHHQPINVPTVFLMDYTQEQRGIPPRGPSAVWLVLTTANAAGTNGLACLPKHGEARDNKFLVTHTMTDQRCLTSAIARRRVLTVGPLRSSLSILPRQILHIVQCLHIV